MSSSALYTFNSHIISRSPGRSAFTGPLALGLFKYPLYVKMYRIYFQDGGLFQAPSCDWWNSRGRGFDSAYLLHCLLLQAGWIKIIAGGVALILLSDFDI